MMLHFALPDVLPFKLSLQLTLQFFAETARAFGLTTRCVTFFFCSIWFCCFEAVIRLIIQQVIVRKVMRIPQNVVVLRLLIGI